MRSRTKFATMFFMFAAILIGTTQLNVLALETPSDSSHKEEAIVDNEVDAEYKTYDFNMDQLLTGDNNTWPFPITIRDFKDDGIIFEGEVPDTWVVEGLVTQTLNENKRPTLTDNGYHFLVKNSAINKDKIPDLNGDGVIDDNEKAVALEEAKAWYETVKDKPYDYFLKDENKDNSWENSIYRYVVYHANQLFHTVGGLNLEKKDQLNLQLNNNGVFEYINRSYFPINNELFGNFLWGGEWDSGKNYHFTVDSHTKFYFDGKKELVFEFEGDDDVWVYIDNQLVIDLGGIHSAAKQTIKIKPDGTVYRQEYGWDRYITTLNGPGYHDFDFYFMERHTEASNLMITTNMEFIPAIELKKIPYVIDVNGQKAYLSENDVVYFGETVYYEFYMANTGQVDLVDVELRDDKLKLVANSSGVYVNNSSLDEEWFELEKISGQEVSQGSLNDFVELPVTDPKEWLRVSSGAFHTVVNSADVAAGKLVNTAVVEASYKDSPVSSHDVSEVIVPVLDIPTETEERVKLLATIDKEIVGNDLAKPYAPGEVVTYQFTIQNDSLSQKDSDQWSAMGMDSLNLVDELKYNESLIKDWRFYTKDGQIFDHMNFNLAAKEELIVYAQFTIPFENIADEVVNHVWLKRQDKNLADDGVSLTVLQPKLTLSKEVIGSGNVNDQFTIQVLGSDGTEVVVRLKANEFVELYPIQYGVTYTIKEVVPMDYKLNDIRGVNENHAFTVAGPPLEYEVVVVNESISTPGLQDKMTLQNFISQFK